MGVVSSADSAGGPDERGSLNDEWCLALSSVAIGFPVERMYFRMDPAARRVLFTLAA